MSEFNHGEMGKAIKRLETPTEVPNETPLLIKSPSGRSIALRAMGLAITAIAGGALMIPNPSSNNKVVTGSDTACVTSPKATIGDTEWDLARQVYPSLDKLKKSDVSAVSSSKDYLLRPGDVITVCVPLGEIATALDTPR